LLANIQIIGECLEEHKLLLAKELKQIKKTICFTGESINDCFSIQESDVGISMSNVGEEYCNRVCDILIDRDIMLIYESIKLGRQMFENIRKFMQYQLIVSINLFLYIWVGYYWFD
jgi:Ca2+-transporting ATPase